MNIWCENHSYIVIFMDSIKKRSEQKRKNYVNIKNQKIHKKRSKIKIICKNRIILKQELYY